MSLLRCLHRPRTATARQKTHLLLRLLNGEPSIELGRNVLALTKLLGLGIALKGDGESRRTRCVRTLTAESETYKYTHYYQIW